MPVLLAHAIEDSIDIFGISGGWGGCLNPRTPPPLGTPLTGIGIIASNADKSLGFTNVEYQGHSHIRGHMDISPPRTSCNAPFRLQRLTAGQRRSWEVSVASRRVKVCRSWSCTEMCNKAYCTGQKGAWSNV